MTVDLKEIKKRISKEWLNAFPELSAYTQSKLYKIAGCCIIGIELIKLPRVEDYRPHFVVYPLWKADLNDCLNSPVILLEVLNKKGLQFSIPYAKHSNYLNEAVECFKKQIPFSMNGDVTLKSLFDLVNSLFNDILVKSNPREQAILFELKFYVALYIDDKNQIRNVINQIQKESKSWNMQMFEMWYGKFDLWLQSFEENISRRNELIKQIANNKQHKKIDQLKCSELIM